MFIRQVSIYSLPGVINRSIKRLNELVLGSRGFSYLLELPVRHPEIMGLFLGLIIGAGALFFLSAKLARKQWQKSTTVFISAVIILLLLINLGAVAARRDLPSQSPNIVFIVMTAGRYL